MLAKFTKPDRYKDRYSLHIPSIIENFQLLNFPPRILTQMCNVHTIYDTCTCSIQLSNGKMACFIMHILPVQLI